MLKPSLSARSMARCEQLLLRVALLDRAARQRRAARRVAEAELPAYLVAEPARGEVVARERALVAIAKHALVERRRTFEHLAETLFAPALAVRLGRALLVFELDAEALAETLDRADEVDLLHLLDEGDRIAPLAAPEALERPARRRHGEARSLLLMERA